MSCGGEVGKSSIVGDMIRVETATLRAPVVLESCRSSQSQDEWNVNGPCTRLPPEQG